MRGWGIIEKTKTNKASKEMYVCAWGYHIPPGVVDNALHTPSPIPSGNERPRRITILAKYGHDPHRLDWLYMVIVCS